jgi:O-methyltransferase involved in polyketide biosynthesis
MSETTEGLGSVQKTLLLPLWGRAVETRKREPLLVDRAAVEIIGKLDYDFSTIAANIRPITRLAWIARAIHVDRSVRELVARRPRATIVNVGCGLDTTFERVDNGQLSWVDLDLPDVIELRSRLVSQGPRRRSILARHLLHVAVPGLSFLSHGPAAGTGIRISPWFTGGEVVKRSRLACSACSASTTWGRRRPSG